MRQKLATASRHLRRFGPVPFARYATMRYVVRPFHRARNTPITGPGSYESLIVGKRGLEIGGPSGFFRRDGQLPLYGKVAALDNCNFAAQTVWEGRIEEGEFAVEGRTLGKQFLSEATEVDTRAPGAPYDLVATSNCLEHVANPLRALESIAAVLRTGGALILVLPRKETNFDRRRQVTTFEHLVGDHRTSVGEDDRTHVSEFVENFDLSLGHHVPSRAALAAMAADNARLRCVHHHVFDLELMREACEFAGLAVQDARSAGTDYVVLAVKP
jgi:SAM-dependent methyltransferase